MLNPKCIGLYRGRGETVVGHPLLQMSISAVSQNTGKSVYEVSMLRGQNPKPQTAHIDPLYRTS